MKHSKPKVKKARKKVAISEEMMDRLDGAISDYKKIILHPDDIITHECRLCGDDDEGECHEACPIFKDTGKEVCHDTPYHDARCHPSHKTCGAMLDYLVDLRERCVIQEEKLAKGVCHIKDLQRGDLYYHSDTQGNRIYPLEYCRVVIKSATRRFNRPANWSSERGDKATLNLGNMELGYAMGSTMVKKIGEIRENGDVLHIMRNE